MDRISVLNKLRLLTPGPTPLPEEVRLALSMDMIHHRKSEFCSIMGSVQEKLRILFGTAGPVLPLACTGTGAMTAAVYSLFGPGERVLSIEAGKFGQRWSEIAKSRGLQISKLQIPWAEEVKPGDIEAVLLDDSRITGVLIQQCETSTGAMLPIREIAEITARRNVLLVVDGISAVGICPCPMDEWGLDCLLTGSQKGLMLPPGLALIALSERAWEKAEKITPGCYYFNLPKERQNLEKGQTNFTTPVNLVKGLKASLGLILGSGLDEIYRKQWALTQLVRAGGTALGLELLIKSRYAWGLTSFRVPDGCDAQLLLRHMQQSFGIVMAGGQDHLKGRIIRFGHMGWVDWGDCMAGLAALCSSLAASGQAVNARFMEPAMEAYGHSVNSYPPSKTDL